MQLIKLLFHCFNTHTWEKHYMNMIWQCGVKNFWKCNTNAHIETVWNFLVKKRTTQFFSASSEVACQCEFLHLPHADSQVPTMTVLLARLRAVKNWPRSAPQGSNLLARENGSCHFKKNARFQSISGSSNGPPHSCSQINCAHWYPWSFFFQLGDHICQLNFNGKSFSRSSYGYIVRGEQLCLADAPQVSMALAIRPSQKQLPPAGHKLVKLIWKQVEKSIGDANGRLVVKVRSTGDEKLITKAKTMVGLLAENISALTECQMWEQVPDTDGNEKAKVETFFANLAKKKEEVNEGLEELKAVCKARGL